MDYQEAIEIHIKECKHRIDIISEFIRKNGNYVKNECNKNIDVLKTAISAMQELQEYKQLGTLKEVRKAVEKQKAQKPEKKRNVFTCGAESHSYHCPYCKFRFINKDDTGFYNGMKTKYCPDCGQKLDWSEEE